MTPSSFPSSRASNKPRAVHWYTCTKPGGGSTTFWVAGPNTQINLEFPQVNPEDVARRALTQLHLRPVSIGIAPKTSSDPKNQAIVGMPVWLWAGNAAPNTTGPTGNSASEGGVTVTLKARVTSFRWDLGDGTSTRCSGKGTPWKKGMTGDSPSGCGHNYLKSGKYSIRAHTQWVVDWTGGGMRGTINLPLTSPAGTIYVTEAQTVVDH